MEITQVPALGTTGLELETARKRQSLYYQPTRTYHSWHSEISCIMLDLNGELQCFHHNLLK